jgi:hypothetical protein
MLKLNIEKIMIIYIIIFNCLWNGVILDANNNYIMLEKLINNKINNQYNKLTNLWEEENDNQWKKNWYWLKINLLMKNLFQLNDYLKWYWDWYFYIYFISK